MTYSERALAYAEGVVNGRVPACVFVRQACQRHLDDLAAVGSSPFWFDTEEADRKCGFLEKLPHVKGKWASSTRRSGSKIGSASSCA